MKTIIHSPHDKVIKSLFANIKLAQDFFKVHLPLALRAKLSLDALQAEPGSFVDAELKNHLTDLLFTVPIEGRTGYLYLLLESQSTVDERMAFRLLRYTVNIQQHHLLQYPNEKLPVVYPLVYYTGNEPASGFVTDIYQCFSDPTLAQEYFLKPFQLVDLQALSDDELLQHKALAGLEMIQKYIYARDMSFVLNTLLEARIFAIFCDEYGRDFLLTLLYYLTNTGVVKEAKQFLKQLTEQLPAEERGYIMTMAEMLKQEGRQVGRKEGRKEGRQEGRQEGLEQAALEMLRHGMDKNRVAQIIQLPDSVLEKLVEQLAVEIQH